MWETSWSKRNLWNEEFFGKLTWVPRGNMTKRSGEMTRERIVRAAINVFSHSDFDKAWHARDSEASRCIPSQPL